ncbi:hypothetical protein [Micromonospora schwarzwaldensis]|uniref:hypothetical protein n=1 Tax=Micromonospora sp. DSM 45708 TaxID=3111767 RepID=UPI0031DEA798
MVILDRKGSHRWALNLAGVDYCTRSAQMHDALVRLAALADERNTLAMHEAEDWDCGPRVLVICEELNATIGQLVNFKPRRGLPDATPSGRDRSAPLVLRGREEAATAARRRGTGSEGQER